MANVPSSISAQSSTVNIYTVLTESSTTKEGPIEAFVGVSWGTDGYFEIGVVVYFFARDMPLVFRFYLITFFGMLLGVLTAV